jgi:uncharacterized damage-inducible protein DinB
LFTAAAAATLQQHAGRIDVCLGKLTEEQIWARPGEQANAVGNLVLHLCGNLRQYTRHAIGGEADVRQRDDEFNAVGGTELRERLAAAVADAASLMEGIGEERLGERIAVQGREMTVLEAVFKTTEHFSLHAGQIYYATKAMTGEALGFFTHKRVGA